jgi:uncharacterized UBP type Zn finger protein
VAGRQSAETELKLEEIGEIAKACEHIERLDQTGAAPIETKTNAHCLDCELSSNLWLCLTCGNLGCGRSV